MSRRIVLPCVLVRSVPPTSFRSAGLAAIPPRAKPSSAYTSPLAAADAALPVRASCARQSRGNEVEVIQVTCMLLQSSVQGPETKRAASRGMAGEMSYHTVDRAMQSTANRSDHPWDATPVKRRPV